LHHADVANLTSQIKQATDEMVFLLPRSVAFGEAQPFQQLCASVKRGELLVEKCPFGFE
jgi:hypothetical protein